MAVRRGKPAPVRNTMLTSSLVDGDPAAIAQSHQRLAAGIDQLERNQRARSKATATLVAGDNVVNHGLGRVPTACTVTPTVADASFAWALTAADDKQATITTVGTTQTNATLEFA